MKKLFCIIAALFLCAFSIDKTLPDEAKEGRAQNLFRQIKCVVCQGQPLSESDAKLAQDMRALIRSQISEGKADADILLYLEGRYGTNIATSPPIQTNTLMLWISPLILLAVGAIYLIFTNGYRKSAKRSNNG